MKKIIFIVLLCISNIAICNALFVIGGHVSLSGRAPSITKDSEKGIIAKTNNDFTFGLTPRVAYMFLEQKLEFGGAIGFNYNQETKYIVLYELENDNLKNGLAFDDIKVENILFIVSPYVRYRIVYVKNFGLWFEGVTTFRLAKDINKIYYVYKGYNDKYEIVKRTQEDVDKFNQIEKDTKTNNFIWGVAIKPILTHDIGLHWRLETELNFLSLGIAGTIINEKYYKNGIDLSDGYVIRKNSTYNYSLGVWNGNVLNVSALTIGVIYKF